MLSTPATYIYQFIAVYQFSLPSDMYAAAYTLHCSILYSGRNEEANLISYGKKTHIEKENIYSFSRILLN